MLESIDLLRTYASYQFIVDKLISGYLLTSVGKSYRNARTRGQFKPRNANKGTSSYQLRQFAEATLGSGSLRKAVKLPDGEDLHEWLAVNGAENLFPVNQLLEGQYNADKVSSGRLL